jgi:hypothetical protein
MITCAPAGAGGGEGSGVAVGRSVGSGVSVLAGAAVGTGVGGIGVLVAIGVPVGVGGMSVSVGTTSAVGRMAVVSVGDSSSTPGVGVLEQASDATRMVPIALTMSQDDFFIITKMGRGSSPTPQKERLPKVGGTRLELVASTMSTWRSSQLS